MQKLGVFWKILDICYKMGTEIFKIEEEMTKLRKLLLSLKLSTPLQKSA